MRERHWRYAFITCEKIPAIKPTCRFEMAQKQSFQMIAEMKEFATFTPAEQRYIRRSLEVAATGIAAADRWCRNASEADSITAQARLYRTLLRPIGFSIPDDIDADAATELMQLLMRLAAFDLGQGKLSSFAAFRFLYERMFGPTIRPWLPSAFLAAAALPGLHPAERKALLGSITAGDAGALGWSIRRCSFMPEWVDKVPVTVPLGRRDIED